MNAKNYLYVMLNLFQHLLYSKTDFPADKTLRTLSPALSKGEGDQLKTISSQVQGSSISACGGITPKKILIIRLSALGDTIHTLPAAYALRKKFPDAQIDWVIEDRCAKFIINNPLIDNVHIIKRKNRSIKDFLQLILNIRKEKYDIALDFQQLFKSALIMGLSDAQRRITLDGGRELSWLAANEVIKTGRPLFDIHYHAVKRNLDLTAALGCDNDEIKFVLPDFSKEYSAEVKNIIQALDKNRKTIVIAPATTWYNKHWTIEGWNEVIKHFQNSCNIIITAQERDKELISRILNGTDKTGIIDLTGKTNLADLVYIFKNADLVISPDSGSAHTAWASGAKAVLTLFFSTSAERTAPFGKNYSSIQAPLTCSPCMKKKCRLKTDKNKCIPSITAEEVINSAASLLI